MSVTDYERMGYDQLHDLLLFLIRGCQHVTFQYDVATRIALLPALTAMKRLTQQPGRRIARRLPTYEEECRSLGLSAALVRKWRKVTATERDIRQMLGEQPRRFKRKTQTPSVEHRRLLVLIAAIVSGDEGRVIELGHRWAEEYDELCET